MVVILFYTWTTKDPNVRGLRTLLKFRHFQSSNRTFFFLCILLRWRAPFWNCYKRTSERVRVERREIASAAWHVIRSKSLIFRSFTQGRRPSSKESRTRAGDVTVYVEKGANASSKSEYRHARAIPLFIHSAFSPSGVIRCQQRRFICRF